MKERLLKVGVVLFLIATLVVAGVYPVTSQAAAKGTTYKVVLDTGSTTLSIVSINNGVGVPTPSNLTGITFNILVESKAKTEKLKTGPASYYPVTVIAKSYKAPTAKIPMIGGGGMSIKSSIMKKDAVGKLYISGGDVDVTSVQGAKKMTTQIGDGTVDPAGSMILPIATTSVITMEATGKVFMETTTITYLTTGKSTCVVKGTKSRLEGKVLPTDDTSKVLAQPLVGKPLDLNAGTGTWVGSNGLLNIKNPTIGMLDYLTGQIWILKISK